MLYLFSRYMQLQLLSYYEVWIPRCNHEHVPQHNHEHVLRCTPHPQSARFLPLYYCKIDVPRHSCCQLYILARQIALARSHSWTPVSSLNIQLLPGGDLWIFQSIFADPKFLSCIWTHTRTQRHARRAYTQTRTHTHIQTHRTHAHTHISTSTHSRTLVESVVS